ncbi:MAG: peptidoglycan bridge formation glycyltransferase FemA/FemB family protein [Patescibacteria group bacterium]|jgi:lipid II:glycine glycyltransferase (peptidoglycan interpeptide bridge formation enzyme)
MSRHVVQSPEWGEFKSSYGTPAVKVGEVQYTKHSIPGSPFFMAYCPKVDPFIIDFEKVASSLKENSCIAINFDVPNITTDSEKASKAVELFEERCERSPRDTFAKHNIILDIAKSEEEIMDNMHKKCRYNVKYAQRNGVEIKRAETREDFDVFYSLLGETSVREKYYIHPKQYYQKIWELMYPQGMCHILMASKDSTALGAWVLFTYEKTLYYPYGGSTDKYRNLFGSNLIGWEAIRLGKSYGCETFDMWGACKDMANETDPWWGFSNFKLKFGGRHVHYIDSYDLIINKPMYKIFTMANRIRWELLTLKKSL